MAPSALTLVGVLVPVPDEPLSAFDSTDGVGCLEEEATGWFIELKTFGE